MLGTTYQFAHHRTVDGERCLIWGNGIGEVLIPVTSPEYIEAMNDRSWNHNALADEGENDLLAVYFRTQAKRATLYGRLYGGTGTPQETYTLATMATNNVVEVSATNGYTPATSCAWTVGDTHFPTFAKTGGAGGNSDWKVTSQTRTFTATGTWTDAKHLILSEAATGTSGLFLAWSPLSATRTLANTDTLDVSVAIELS
jgi:hypothetical protein